MPKIPYTPPPRGPRLPPYEPPPLPPCETCLGTGELYRVNVDDSKTPIDCWVCGGSGKTLANLPEEDTHSEGDVIPWSNTADDYPALERFRKRFT